MDCAGKSITILSIIMKPKYKSYFVRNHKPGAKYKYRMRFGDYIFDLNSSRRNAKKIASKLIKEYELGSLF